MAAVYNEQASIPRSSATFEFVSHFPELHMPFARFEDPGMGNPKREPSEVLQDGELVELQEGGRIAKISDVGELKLSNVYLFHGKVGRSDIQVAGGGPIVKDTRFEFRTRLHDEADSLSIGDFVTAKVLTSGNFAQHCGFGPAAAGEYHLGVVVSRENDDWVRIRFERGVVPA